MSLVVAVQVKGNDVVFAADRRGTIGDPQGVVALDENMPKLFQYGKRAILGIVGFPSAVLIPVREALTQLQAQLPADPAVALSAALRAHYQAHYGLRPLITSTPVQDARPFAVVLYGDRRPNGEGLISMGSPDNFTPLPNPRPYAIAGVNLYAQYLFQRFWRDDFTVDEALRLGAFMICETNRLDPKVGPMPDLMVLGEDGIRELPRGEIDKIVTDNEKRLKRFSQSFRSAL